MQTFLDKAFRETPEGREADRILRSCVHCGFCNATCPTYQLLGDERDGPRGRIYLIKEMLEHGRASRETQLHLDRCLTCRACETTCPSGVEYSKLLEIGRSVADRHVKRPLGEKILRKMILSTAPKPQRMMKLMPLARLAKPLLPRGLAGSVPTTHPDREPWPHAHHARKVLILQGCVQSVHRPEINHAAARVLNRLGIQAIPADGCCGALPHHLSAEEQTLETARRNIDRWWPLIEEGAESLLLTASGCATTVLDYGRLLADDPKYAKRAEKLSRCAMDISKFMAQEDLSLFHQPGDLRPTVAFHSPCTLQHGLKSVGEVESLLREIGFELTVVADSHLCCGSAGTYSILQPELSEKLREKKVSNLQAGQPDLVATANIGCLAHLQKGTHLPVMHWIELVDLPPTGRQAG